MRNLLILCVTITLYNSVSAQPLRNLMPRNLSRIVTHEVHMGIDGSQYLFDDWKPGTINLKNGNIIQGLSFRYNVYKNEFRYIVDTNEYAISAPDSIQELNMAGKRFVYSEIEKAKTTERSFFEIALEGKATLLVKYYIKIIPSNYNVALDAGSPNDRMAIKEQYYLRVGDKINTIDKKGKIVLKILADKQTELANFIDKEDISLKKKEDLIKAINYYNSL